MQSASIFHIYLDPTGLLRSHGRQRLLRGARLAATNTIPGAKGNEPYGFFVWQTCFKQIWYDLEVTGFHILHSLLKLLRCFCQLGLIEFSNSALGGGLEMEKWRLRHLQKSIRKSECELWFCDLSCCRSKFKCKYTHIIYVLYTERWSFGHRLECRNEASPKSQPKAHISVTSTKMPTLKARQEVWGTERHASGVKLLDFIRILEPNQLEGMGWSCFSSISIQYGSMPRVHGNV